MKRFIKTCGLLSLLLLSACSQIEYYSQLAKGQLALMNARMTPEAAVASGQLTPHQQQRLEEIPHILDFARTRLQLPVENHYSRVVVTGRPYVSWNLFAAPALSVEPRLWCYPIAGCVEYRGYFSEADARRQAQALGREGWDTWVGGVTAYSTLGWFEDPILDSFLHLAKGQLASLLFHELAHQKLYVAGDTAFNESFATSVTIIGMEAWQATQADDGERDWLTRMHRQQQVVCLVSDTRKQLEKLYQSQASEQHKLDAKEARIHQLREGYQRMKGEWNGDPSYDNWFGGPLNNAQLNTLNTYHVWVPAFLQLYIASGQQLDRFYQQADRLGRLAENERTDQLETLTLAYQPTRLTEPGLWRCQPNGGTVP